MKLTNLHEDLAYAKPMASPSMSERTLSFHELPDIVRKAYLSQQPYESVKKAYLIYDYDDVPVYVVVDTDGIEYGFYEDGNTATNQVSEDL